MHSSGDVGADPLDLFVEELRPLYDGLDAMTHDALGTNLNALLRQVGDLPAPRQTAPYGLFERQIKQAMIGLRAFDLAPGWRELTPVAYQYHAQPLWQYATVLAGLGHHLGNLGQAVVTDARPGARREWEPERQGLIDWAQIYHVEWNQAERIDSSFYAAQLFTHAARQLLYPEMIRQLWSFWLDDTSSQKMTVFGTIYKDRVDTDTTFSTAFFNLIREGVNQDTIAIHRWPGTVWIWQGHAAIALHGLISSYAKQPPSVLSGHRVETTLAKLDEDRILDIRHGKLTKCKDDGAPTVLDLVLIPTTHIWPATEIPKASVLEGLGIDIEMV